MPPSSRHRAQLAGRIAGLALVVAWLLSPTLRTYVPFWLPFAVLAATEVELFLRGLREIRRDAKPVSPETVRQRRLPGEDDADLGWGGMLDVDEETVLDAAALERLLPEPRERRSTVSRRLGYLAGLGIAAILFALALRADERGTWSSLSTGEQRGAEKQFSIAAGVIAERHVSVRCDEHSAFTGAGADASGVAFPRRALAYLEPDVCRTLHDLAVHRSRRSAEEMAWAIAVLAHEAVHLGGVRSESVTECYALQHAVALAERLGIAPDEARRLMRAQYDRDLADRSIDRFAYRLSNECRDGGALDLRPGDDAFP